MEKSKYYVGLDMGTSSCGWAVTDENYVIQRAKGKDMWGVRLFPEAKTAADRRTARISRRRRQRQVARINYLNMCFAPEIEKIDSGFLMRLKESKYHLEDRSEENRQKFAIFNDKSFTDKEYFEKYPTIFHLRKELLESKPIVSHDVRLVYLALLNMFKHRGNFLNDNLSIDSKESSIKDAYESLCETASYFDIEFPEKIDTDLLEHILGKKDINKKEKLEEIANLTGIAKKENPRAYELLLLICGSQGKLINIFGNIVEEENKKYSFAFSDSNFEEKASEIIDLIGDEYYELVLAAKEIYDIGLLANIMKGHNFLSEARVMDYKAHHDDLILLKGYLKDYDKSAYEAFFRKMGEGNYSAYVGSVNSDKEKVRRNGGKLRNSDDLYKTIKSIIKKLPQKAQEDPRTKTILTKIENEDFLVKQLTGSNGVIPNQVHAREMKKILDNAATYLPFLNDIDESGLTTSERLLQMFTFHIPYYVGPLGQEHVGEDGYNVWAKRISAGKIYPWNLAEKIDVERAAEDFITRMLRRCTYLQDQKALPKQSLLYEKFMVLDELNNLRINGEKITPHQKQDIFQTLFMKGKKVTSVNLAKYLVSNGLMDKNDSPDSVISGIDGDFKSSLSSVGKFAPIFGTENIYGKDKNMIENIIFWGTVFGNDKKIKIKKLKEYYGENLDNKTIERIAGFSFNGWGNLSREFLEMPGKKGSLEEEKSIIISMWESNENLMELLSDSHTFKDEIENRISNKQKELLEWSVEDLDEMYLSPSVKRMVWQTMLVLKDIYTVKKCAPSKIFVEMPREDGEKGKRTKSRKKMLEELYKGQKDVLAEIANYEEKDFKQRKLYLYYLQNGKSLYTGNSIDLENLLSNNSRYDIDHIYPRHYTKDDSLDNNLVLVEKEINNDLKGGDYPISPDIQAKMGSTWKELLRKKFINKEKYDRLIRKTEFTEQELANFIARQLVETRQGTKAITQILKQAFPDTKIVFSKASVVSSFRQKYNIPKVRSLNDCHHAHDAYLNIVVGNTYYVKFTANPINFIREAGKYWKDPSYKYHMEKIFDHHIERNGETAWIPQKDNNPGTIKIVKSMLGETSMLFTSKPYCQKGGITRDVQPVCGKKTVKNPYAYWPLKTSDYRLQKVDQYGGYNGISIAAYALVEYTEKGKSIDKDKGVRALIGIPIYLGKVTKESEKLLAFINNKVLLNNSKKTIVGLSIKMYPIMFGDVIDLDGYMYTIGGVTDNYIYLKDFVPLYLNVQNQQYLKKLEKADSLKDYKESKDGNLIITKEKNIELFRIFVNKFQNTIYKNKKCSIANILINGEGIFEKLDIPKQCHVIMQVLRWFNTADRSVDLSDLKESGGSANAGTLRMKNTISDYNEVILIQSSPSGLYQKKVNLLKI